jgi:hypothetical protein
MVFGFLFGYNTADDADDEKEEKKTEEIEDLEDIPPPPVLKRENGYYTECKNIDVIRWKNYDAEFEKVDNELKEMKKILADLDIIVKKSQDTAEDLVKLDKEWQNRLSPVEEVVELKTKKKRKRKKTNNNV